MFSKQQIKQLANNASYQRGVEYFENGAVRKITRRGDTFEAKVSGSSQYRVSLEIEKGGDLDFECSCPYDHDGICKHSVALGLAVLSEFSGTFKDAPKTSETSVNEPITDFLRIFEKTKSKEKLRFLQSLLQKDPNLQQQFVRFMTATAPVVTAKKTTEKPAVSSKKRVEMLSTEVYEKLSDLTFDDKHLAKYARKYGYNFDDILYDEGDMLYDLGDKIMTDLLKPYADKLRKVLQEGKILEATEMWLGVYEGCISATEPQADDYDMMGDFVETSTEAWFSLLEPAYALIEKTLFAPAETQQSIDLLVERCKHLDKEAEKQNDEEMGVYELKVFEPFLMALSADPEIAKYLYKSLKTNNLLDTDVAFVVLKIAKITNDDKLHVETAEYFADSDPDIAAQLLQKYVGQNDRPNLLRVANKVWPRFKDRFNDFVITNISAQEDAPLHLQALESRCVGKTNLADYDSLRKFWNEKQRNGFIDKHKMQWKNSGSHLFLSQLLELENRISEIKDMLEQMNWDNTRNLPKLLQITAKYYPAECSKMTKKRADDALANGQRGRDLYQRIASWLEALHKIPELQQNTLQFADYLATEYSRLSALREELRNVKLWRK